MLRQNNTAKAYKNYKEHFYRFILAIKTIKTDGNLSYKAVAKEFLAVNKWYLSNKTTLISINYNERV